MNGEYKARTDLVEKETSKTRGDDGVTDQEVPVGPLPFDPAERGKVCASVELLCGILVEDRGGYRSRVKGHDRVGMGGGAGFGQRLAIFYTFKNRTTLFFPRLLRFSIYPGQPRKERRLFSTVLIRRPGTKAVTQTPTLSY